MKPIYLEWEDASSNDKWVGECDAMAWADAEGFVVKQTGFILKETKKSLTLCGGYHHYEDCEPQYHQLLKIPKSWIRKRINLTKYIK